MWVHHYRQHLSYYHFIHVIHYSYKHFGQSCFLIKKNQISLFLCSSLQVPSPLPCLSRLSRRPITSCSPTHGSMGPSPASRQPTWSRALDRRDTECFWSDRVRHAEETMSSRLTTREKQRYV